MALRPAIRLQRLPLAALLAVACAAPSRSYEPPALPEELREPRVLSSRLGLEGIVAFTAAVGRVTEVSLLADGSLAISGTRAALLIRGPGDVARTAFPTDSGVAWDVIRTDLDGDGADELVNRGGNWHPVWVRDAASGQERWRSEFGANVLRIADLDADGRRDLLLGMNGAGGIHRLDASGREVWAAEAGNVRQIEVAELDPGSPGSEILHSDACGLLVMRDGGGRVLRKIQPPSCASHFAPLADAQGEPALWIAAERALHRLRLRDGQHLEVALPIPTGWAEPLAARVRLAARDYEAVLLDDRVRDRAILAIVGADGALDHLQVLDSSCAFLAPWRERESGALVLGCRERVLVFAPPIEAWSAALAIRERVYGASSPALLEDRVELAGALREADRLAEAEAQLAAAQRIADALPDTHVGRARLANAWALALGAGGEPEGADAKLAEALRLLEGSPDADPRLHSDVHHNLAQAAQRRQDWRTAERHYRRSLALLGAGPPGANAAGSAYGLAQVLLEQGRAEEAVAWAELALAGDLRSYGPNHREVALDRALLERITSARRGAAPASPARPAADLR